VKINTETTIKSSLIKLVCLLAICSPSAESAYGDDKVTMDSKGICRKHPSRSLLMLRRLIEDCIHLYG